MPSSNDLYEFLKSNQIDFIRYDHPAVFTCEEAAINLKGLEGAGSKNLFLRTKKGDRFLLVTVPESKRVDLRVLSRFLGCDRLGFGSSAELMEYLGVEAGSVTLLAAINDSLQRVEIFVDEELWAETLIQSHPLINTSTLLIAPSELDKFFRALNRNIRLIAIASVNE